MQISFKGKRAVVAGGSRGIGRSIALAFADAGAAVSICARGRAALDKTSAEIMGRGVRHMRAYATWPTRAPSPSTSRRPPISSVA